MSKAGKKSDLRWNFALEILKFGRRCIKLDHCCKQQAAATWFFTLMSLSLRSRTLSELKLPTLVLSFPDKPLLVILSSITLPVLSSHVTPYQSQ